MASEYWSLDPSKFDVVKARDRREELSSIRNQPRHIQLPRVSQNLAMQGWEQKITFFCLITAKLISCSYTPSELPFLHAFDGRSHNVAKICDESTITVVGVTTHARHALLRRTFLCLFSSWVSRSLPRWLSIVGFLFSPIIIFQSDCWTFWGPNTILVLPNYGFNLTFISAFLLGGWKCGYG